MAAPHIDILPLDDVELPESYERRADPVVPPALEQRAAQLREALDGLCNEVADADGFAITTYGQLVDAIAGVYPQSVQFLLDNPWAVRYRLDGARYSAAPDGMLERRKLKEHDKVVLFTSEREVPTIRRRPYKKGLLFVKLLTLALRDLSEAEMRRAAAMIRQWVADERYARHLEAMLRWYNVRRRLLDRTTSRTFHEILTPDDRALLASQLLDIAAQRGVMLTAAELTRLERLTAMCGALDGDIHAALHRRQCVAAGRLLPSHLPEPSGNAIDPAALRRIEKSTSQVQSLLADVLSQHDDAEQASEPATSAALLQTDTSRLACALEGRERISLAELAEGAGLPESRLAILLEQLNDAAYDLTDDAVVEIDGDTVHIVNPDILQQLK